MANWSLLPRDLLNLILEKLSVANRVQFGAVCSTWRAATLEEGLLLPFSKHPWLLHPSDNDQGNETVFNFYSLPSLKKVYQNKVFDQLRGKRCIGSCKGWLVAVDEGFDVYMLHPLSGTIILLPSPATLPELEPVYDSESRITSYYNVDYWDNRTLETPENLHNFYFKKVILSSPNPKNCMVVAMKYFGYPLAYARVGDTKWTSLEGATCIKDVIHYRGQFYAVRRHFPRSDYMEVVAWDFSGPSPVQVRSVAILNKKYTQSKYLVESSGDLLLVLRDVDAPTDQLQTYRTTNFHVYKLDETRVEWVQVKSIGDHVLFLGHNYSTSLSSHEFPELERNCIYFTDDYPESCFGWRDQSRDLGVFHLEDGSIKAIHPCASELKWPPPIWFIPTLQ